VQIVNNFEMSILTFIQILGNWDMVCSFITYVVAGVQVVVVGVLKASA
jgi:hypothetical protein